MLAGLFILIPSEKMYPMVAFIDVGQGDGIFMRTANGTTWLIDGGSSDVQNVGKYRIIPFMNYYGEKSIDYACVSHEIRITYPVFGNFCWRRRFDILY